MPLPDPSPAVAGLQPYSVPRHGAPLDLLLDGIGGLRPPPDLFRLLDDADPEQLVRQYPSTAALAAALAERHGITPDRVLVTGGGDDGLDRACRALLAPGRSLVLPVPTFEMIERYARWAGAAIRTVPWDDGPYPVEAVLATADATTTAVAVVSPNNPTGAVATVEEVRRLSEALPGAVLLVDLAYVEFADVDPTAELLALPNVVVFRTLSKAWGLAGLRVGFAMGPAMVIGWMRAAGNPYTVSGASAHIALRRLATGQAEVDAYVAAVRAQRDGLADVLREVGAKPQRSQANFVFARTPRAAWVRDGLAGLGIGVRTWPGHPTLGDAVRINVPGDEAVFERLSHALRAVLAPEAILFDMDGVLVDVSSSYREAIVRTCARFGADVSHDEIRAAKARGHANNDWVLTQRLLGEKGVDVPLEEVTAAFEALYQGNAATPGLKLTERCLLDHEALTRIAARHRLAVVTGRPRSDALEFLERHGLADLFPVLVCMEDGPSKPDPAPVRTALERLGVRYAWMLGDTPDDVVAARAAGVVPIGVVPPGEDIAAVSGVLTRAGAARVLPATPDLLELLP